MMTTPKATDYTTGQGSKDSVKATLSFGQVLAACDIMPNSKSKKIQVN